MPPLFTTSFLMRKWLIFFELSRDELRLSDKWALKPNQSKSRRFEQQRSETHSARRKKIARHIVYSASKKYPLRKFSNCLSNPTYGQNINLPVCVCVCVCPSQFLSTRLQVRPLNGFFYSWYLKRRGFTQGCAFWGSRWWIITFRGSKSPKTPLLGAWISISSQICEKFK